MPPVDRDSNSQLKLLLPGSIIKSLIDKSSKRQKLFTRKAAAK